jgi:hypothetical protein
MLMLRYTAAIITSPHEEQRAFHKEEGSATIRGNRRGARILAAGKEEDTTTSIDH